MNKKIGPFTVDGIPYSCDQPFTRCLLDVISDYHGGPDECDGWCKFDIDSRWRNAADKESGLPAALGGDTYRWFPGEPVYTGRSS
jgi:hypothetical protein